MPRVPESIPDARAQAREEHAMPQKISPFLWFDGTAEEAATFYVSVFPDSEVTAVSRYGEAGPGPAGSAMVVSFKLDGQEFSALNGGPQFTFSEAVSFLISCGSQARSTTTGRRSPRAASPAPAAG
jgi:predicted 3-demethylubiquinone-9 3-methyltransferase (glyoxalase superfamily)